MSAADDEFGILARDLEIDHLRREVARLTALITGLVDQVNQVKWLLAMEGAAGALRKVLAEHDPTRAWEDEIEAAAQALTELIAEAREGLVPPHG